MRYSMLITAVAASLAATAGADNLLDSVLDSPSDAPKAQAVETAKTENPPAGQDADDVRKLREEVAALRQKLGSQTPPSTANEKVRPIEEKPIEHIANPATLYLRGGYGASMTSVCSADWTMPISGSNFDLSIRGFLLATDRHLVTYEYKTRRTYYDRLIDYADQDNGGGEALCIWRPLRGKLFSPYVAGGLRYESVKVVNRYWGYRAGYRGEFEEKKGGASLAGRVGVLLDLKRVFLVGEYIVGSDSSELIGDVSFYLTRRMKLHAFAEYIDLDLASGTAFGGGLSFDF